MAGLRIAILLVALAGMSWFNFVNEAPAHALARSVMDRFDDRPARKLLFVGNSRMHTNSVPDMVREMADSAGATEKYQITMIAPPGYTLRMHWQDGKVQQALAGARWDGLVFQAASGEQATEESQDEFRDYGARMAAEAKRHRVPASLIIGWTYGPKAFLDPVEGPAEYQQLIQSEHRALALRTDLKLVDVGGGFEDFAEAQPRIPLMTDGNHPSVQGSYLAALMIYAHLSGTDASSVSYVPEGMTEAEAAEIRGSVRGTLRWRI